ncbi:Protein MtfA [wastewater metagenome]|uniref:Protein MtfA n=2 Tax=unclassified sequences TaxID=12908 RepID=A0A5B8R9M9_9ZZZZ|nr:MULTISPECIES: M90 family metallopeptidase [Arhodomonas]MCS4503764.1 zinc-dependent peptidase [Arhodomonas aquaeolei]QEA04713.1 protein MtfA [uncultured organism]
MIARVLRGWWRGRQLRRYAVDDALWRRATHSDSVLAGLDAGERVRLRELATLFLARKRFYAAGGGEFVPEQAVRIAALAAVPVLGLDIDWYRGWQSVIVYPSGFLARHREMDEAGVVHDEARALAGEAWDNGPVILSWSDVEAGGRRDGWNVVLHELAHKLDMLNGEANGMPPLHRGMDRRAWTRAFTEAFEAINAAVEAGRDPGIDDYAATDPAECFAVFSETFLEMPEVVAAHFPAVHEQLAAFYRRTPAEAHAGHGPAGHHGGRSGSRHGESR